MEKILITNSPSGNDTAKKIQETLKKAGFHSRIGATSINEDKEPPEVVIAVLTSDSPEDEGMTTLLKECEQASINVVPFVTEKLPKNIFCDFFLDEHVWIDAASQSMNAALGDLGDLMKRNFKELSKSATKKKSDFGKKAAVSSKPETKKAASQQPSEKEKIYKNLFFVSIAVLLVMLFILIKGGVKQENREAMNQQANYQNSLGNSNIKIELSNELTKSETMLVGHWKMSNYIDNQYRATHEDSVKLQTMVDELIKNVSLTFNADKTFSRTGYTETPEHGTWEYDPQSKYLKLKPTNINQYDIVQIQEVTTSRLILVVSEKMDNNQVITRLIFSKIN